MRWVPCIFLTCFVFSQIAWAVDFPTVPQPAKDEPVYAPDSNVVAFPKPTSETDLDFISFPKPESETDLDFIAFPKPTTDIDSENGGITAFPEPKDTALMATEFPKNIKDLSFKSKLELLIDGYTPYEVEYDENGVCVSGCAYSGVTIAEDMEAVDEATEAIANLIDEEYEDNDEDDDDESSEHRPHKPHDNHPVAKDWCRNGLSTKLPLRYPVDMTKMKYPIVSDFGFRTRSANGARFHPAVDIGCPSGTPVYATADGVVKYADNQTTPGGAGNWVGIEHSKGLLTMYLHLSKILVKKGQRVRACDKIGLSGKSGNDINGNPYTGPHLDYRIRFNSKKNNYVDILCPCKASTKTGHGQTSTTNMKCTHSLFNAPYKFKQGAKHSNWRVEHGHCMKKSTDLLPDEKRGELKTNNPTNAIKIQ